MVSPSLASEVTDTSPECC